MYQDLIGPDSYIKYIINLALAWLCFNTQAGILLYAKMAWSHKQSLHSNGEPISDLYWNYYTKNIWDFNMLNKEARTV